MRSRTLLTVSISTLLAGAGLAACSPSPMTGPTAGSPTTAATAPVSAVAVVPLGGQSSAPVSAPSTAGTTASSASPGGPPTDKCSTQNLRWTLTHLAAPGTDTRHPANVELVAVNSGSRGCTLAGYPKVEFRQGKGPEAHGVGNGSPAPVVLGPGRRAVIVLRYAELNGKGPNSDNCDPAMVTAGAAVVTAPGDGTAVRVPVLDQSGKPAQVTVCGNELFMSPPVAR